MAASRFLKLLFETRHQIYKYFYTSITLTYPWCKHPLLSSLPREIRDDSLPTLYENARFKFNTTEHLMDFLTSIDAAALRQLRHISARSHPLVLYRRPNDYSYSHAYSFPIVLQLFPGLQLSTLTVRDTYHEPGTQHDGFGDEAAYEMVEHLIKSDGFRESVYISTSDCFMQPNDFEAYPADKSPKVKETSNRDPQPSTWDKLMKQRDGMNSDAGVEMFRHTKDGRVPLRDEFENPAPLDDNPKFMATDPASMRTCSHMEDTGRREVIEVRVKRGQGADYSQTGECSTNYERGLHGFFKKRTWQQIKEQGLNVEVRDEDPAAWL